jgi:hypothetical protein
MKKETRMQTILKATIATIALTVIMAIPASAITQAECQQIQQTDHQMAECARQLGYPEDSVIIQEAQKKWWEAQNSVWRGPVLTARAGAVIGPSGKETYYNLPMQGVARIMRGLGYSETEFPYWIRSDGCKMLGDKIMVAANLSVHPRGSVVETSLGCGLVCDTGGFARNNPTQIDIATSWG